MARDTSPLSPRLLFERDSDVWNLERKPLLEWAQVAVALGEHETAATLLAADETHRTDPHTEPSDYSPKIVEADQALNAARDHLDPERYDAAWNRGLRMTSTEALDYALDNFTTGSA